MTKRSREYYNLMNRPLSDPFLPLPGGGRQGIFTIYAWNEFGEGGIVAPTRSEQTMKLDAIRAVFGSQ